MNSELKRLLIEERESHVFFTEEMLRNNVLIEESTVINEENQYQTLIEVQHFNDIDASCFIMYQGDMLAAIQVYRIVKDIHEIYLENSLQDFLLTVYNLSETSISSSYQSDRNRKLDIFNDIKESFEEVRSYI